MKAKHLIELDTDYDIELLVFTAKANMFKFVAEIMVFGILLVLSILAIILYGSYMLVFIGGIIVACVSVFICSKLIKNFAFSDYSSVDGEIAYIHKEIKIVPTVKIGGINPFGTRKYDNYSKNEIRLEVYIQNGEDIHACFLKDVVEEHADYYESKGKAIHIWGTHFPVKLEIDKEKWLCPVCGKFNENEEKYCARCNRKILK